MNTFRDLAAEAIKTGINLPWLQPPLDEWDIVGMNHYFVNKQRYLFCAMTKNGRCIKAEGDEDEVFELLAKKAEQQ